MKTKRYVITIGDEIIKDPRIHKLVQWAVGDIRRAEGLGKVLDILIHSKKKYMSFEDLQKHTGFKITKLSRILRAARNTALLSTRKWDPILQKKVYQQYRIKELRAGAVFFIIAVLSYTKKYLDMPNEERKKYNPVKDWS